MTIATKTCVGIAALLMFLIPSEPAEAQFLGEVVCWWCFEEGGKHSFSLNGRGCGVEGEYPDDPTSAQCARCGGTSECHYDERPGPCHIACGPDGDVILTAVTEIQEAVKTEDVAVVASALVRARSGISVEFIPEGGRIDLVLACRPSMPFSTIAVVPKLRAALLAELHAHPSERHQGHP